MDVVNAGGRSEKDRPTCNEAMWGQPNPVFLRFRHEHSRITADSLTCLEVHKC